MDNATRLQYLDAMGIDVWIPKESTSEHDLISFEAGSPENKPVQDKLEVGDDKWNTLEREVRECEKCALCQTRTQTVFGVGNINADWMFIGEAPGKSEDLEGKPFLGQTGSLLMEMIRSIGLQREQVYIANILKCSPPEKRDPKKDEIDKCQVYLHRQIDLVKPKIIVAVGRIAAQTLLKTKDPLSKLRGNSYQFNGSSLVVIYHPAYLLRALPEKRKAWQDMQLAIKTFQEL
jgi:DNA polymerase